MASFVFLIALQVLSLSELDKILDFILICLFVSFAISLAFFCLFLYITVLISII